MRYFEAKVLVPLDAGAAKVERWESYLLRLFGGFHKGASVQGRTVKWGTEYMVPYHVAFEGDSTWYDNLDALTRAAKHYFDQEAIYIAVTELVTPFIR